MLNRSISFHCLIQLLLIKCMFLIFIKHLKLFIAILCLRSPNKILSFRKFLLTILYRSSLVRIATIREKEWILILFILKFTCFIDLIHRDRLYSTVMVNYNIKQASRTLLSIGFQLNLILKLEHFSRTQTLMFIFFQTFVYQ